MNRLLHETKCLLAEMVMSGLCALLIIAPVTLSCVAMNGCCSPAQCQEPDRIVVPHPKIEQDGNAMKPYICVFSATWCGPCQEMKPSIDALRKEGILIYVIDVDKAPESKTKMGVRSLPTILFMANGQEHARLVGKQSQDTLRDTFNQFDDSDTEPDDSDVEPDDDDAGIDLPKPRNYKVI